MACASHLHLFWIFADSRNCASSIAWIIYLPPESPKNIHQHTPLNVRISSPRNCYCWIHCSKLKLSHVSLLFFSVSRPPNRKLSIILPAGMERFFSFWNKYESKMGFTQFFQIFRWWENPPQICQSGNLTGQTISFGRWILYLGGIDWGGAVSLDVILFQYTDTRPLYIQYWLGVNVANIHHILIFKSSDSILWVFCCSAIDLGLL